MTQADRDRSMHLVELALDFAERPAGGAAISWQKVVRRRAFQPLLRLRTTLGLVKIRQPEVVLPAQSGTLSAGSAVVL